MPREINLCSYKCFIFIYLFYLGHLIHTVEAEIFSQPHTHPDPTPASSRSISWSPRSRPLPSPSTARLSRSNPTRAPRSPPCARREPLSELSSWPASSRPRQLQSTAPSPELRPPQATAAPAVGAAPSRPPVVSQAGRPAACSRGRLLELSALQPRPPPEPLHTAQPPRHQARRRLDLLPPASSIQSLASAPCSSTASLSPLRSSFLATRAPPPRAPAVPVLHRSSPHSAPRLCPARGTEPRPSFVSASKPASLQHRPGPDPVAPIFCSR